jgi:polyferredoxin
MALGTPAVIVGALILWPFIDSIAGPRIAKRVGWKKWPVPGRNIYTGTGWILFLAFLIGLTLWALAGPDFCLPWFTGPVCGA